MDESQEFEVAHDDRSKQIVVVHVNADGANHEPGRMFHSWPALLSVETSAIGELNA
jgi:hypothetical protein